MVHLKLKLRLVICILLSYLATAHSDPRISFLSILS
jgi:hypothetical protein